MYRVTFMTNGRIDPHSSTFDNLTDASAFARLLAASEGKRVYDTLEDTPYEYHFHGWDCREDDRFAASNDVILEQIVQLIY